jgi:hypothetical protein
MAEKVGGGFRHWIYFLAVLPDPLKNSSMKATVLNRIKIAGSPEVPEIMRIMDEKFYPPKGWDESKKPYRPKSKTVSVSIPEGLADLGDFLARAYGVPRQKMLSILLIEKLQDALALVRKAHREAKA